MAGPSGEKMDWLYNEESAKPKSEDYLLGKAIDANFERGTLGQINAVEYGNFIRPILKIRWFFSFFPFFQIAHRLQFLLPKLSIKWIFNENYKKIL